MKHLKKVILIGILILGLGYQFIFKLNIPWGECYCDENGDIVMCWDGYVNRLYFILNRNVCYDGCCPLKSEATS